MLFKLFLMIISGFLPPKAEIPKGETPEDIGVIRIKSELPPDIQLPPSELEPGTLAEATIKRTLGYGPAIVNFPAAWEKDSRAKGRGVKIAVIDTGAQVDHPWLKDNIKGTYNAITKKADVADGNGHGTHVAGTIVEALPECELYILKGLADNGSGNVVDLAHAMDYAVQVFKVDIISCSFGGPRQDAWQAAAIVKANKEGVIVMCAAGNSGPNDNTDGFPARFPQCVSVGAVDQDRKIATFSSRGKSVAIVTPGVKIVSAYPGNRQATMSGTSMACPLASGLAGAWVATNPHVEKVKRPAEFLDAITKSASIFPDRNNSFGYGIPDMVKALGKSPNTVSGVNIQWKDLSAEKRAELLKSGINNLDLKIEFGNISSNLCLPKK